jgi:4-hydroxy-tetrahydrodipicolinate reductase
MSVPMQVFIAGSGKLATELLSELPSDARFAISSWVDEPAPLARSIVIHAGSGRQLAGISAYCSRTASILVELATGSPLEGTAADYPLILCPNTNILMLKFMHMLERSGHLFKGNEVHVTESHQSTKTSTAGTAVAIANSLGIPAADVVCVRDPETQANSLHILPEHLSRHALHRIEIQNGTCQITMETRVYGNCPYASGVRQIIAAIDAHSLENRVYAIGEFIENGWI